MPQFRVLESSGGITVDALVTVDANSHQFTPAEQAQVSELDNPRSVSGSKLRRCVRATLTNLCEEIDDEISSVEFCRIQDEQANQRRAEGHAAEVARNETKAEFEEQIAALNAKAEEATAAHLRDMENAVEYSKLAGAASRDDEVTKLSQTVLALQRELRQLKADAEFQQAADEARRVARNQARKAQRATKAAEQAKAERAHQAAGRRITSKRK